jgi:hypothetical protein
MRGNRSRGEKESRPPAPFPFPLSTFPRIRAHSLRNADANADHRSHLMLRARRNPAIDGLTVQQPVIIS